MKDRQLHKHKEQLICVPLDQYSHENLLDTPLRVVDVIIVKYLKLENSLYLPSIDMHKNAAENMIAINRSELICLLFMLMPITQELKTSRTATGLQYFMINTTKPKAPRAQLRVTGIQKVCFLIFSSYY